MADHLIVIPGFGMKASALCMVPQPAGLASGFQVHEIDPAWIQCKSLASLASHLAEKLMAVLSSANPNDRIVVYGFSIGADILMKILVGKMLTSNQKTVFVLADPNTGPETCSITRLAESAGKKDVFVDWIDAKIRDAIGVNKMGWEKYRRAIQDGFSPSDWHFLKNIAKSIVVDPAALFKAFCNLIREDGSLLAQPNIKIMAIYSEDGRLGLNATPKWMSTPNGLHHFQLSEPAMITEYANSALQLLVD